MSKYPKRSLHHLIHLGADFKRQGLSVRPDWRYDLVCDYLKASPSYESVRCYHLGQKLPYPLPKDHKQVLKVFEDFGPIYKLKEASWWQEIGMGLYGVSDPLPEVQVLGLLGKNEQKITANLSSNEALVVTLPLDLTITEVIKQLKRKAADYDFSTNKPKKLVPKYTLERTKLTQRTLQDGLDALRLYKRKIPLWKIGNKLRLISGQCFDESELQTDRAYLYGENKELLSIAASRLIKKATLIAENAARGRFPTDKPLAQAITTPYQRDKGRPVGSKATKRKKAQN